MKILLSFLLGVFCFTTVFGQNFSKSDFYGTWKTDNGSLTLKSNGTFSEDFNSYSTKKGTWKLEIPYHLDIGSSKKIVLNYSSSYDTETFQIDYLYNSKLRLIDYYNSSTSYTFTKSSSRDTSRSSGITAEQAVIGIGALLLFGALIGADSDDSSSESSFDRNLRESKQAKQNAYEERRRNGGN